MQEHGAIQIMEAGRSEACSEHEEYKISVNITHGNSLEPVEQDGDHASNLLWLLGRGL